jgi:DNA polymerase-1
MALPERLVLVDGNALLYRAYHALPARFSTAAGLPTNAVYGFATMFRKIFAGRRPRRGAVVFDPPGPTARDRQYREYKSGREAMPEDLKAQLSTVDRLVAAHNFPLLRVAGHEADDVIGTLARRAVEAGMEVVIVSGDKDFAQLVTDGVRMFDPVRDVVYDPELVRKRWGVRPEHFADYLALVGDRADNIPGVPGIGAKGAAELLARHGSLAAILDHLGELEGRFRKSLEEHRDRALLSRELATIDCRLPLEVTLDDLAVEPPPAAALNALYRELEFFSLLGDEEAVRRAAVEEADYAACRSLAEVDSLLAALPAESPVTVLPIHDERSPIYGSLAALVLCPEPGRARLVPIIGRAGLARAGLERLRPWLLDPERPKVTYNAKFLWIALRRQGLAVEGLAGDLLLESFLVNPTKIIPHRLEQITKEYLQRTLPDDKTVRGRGRGKKPFTALDVEVLTPWACHRAAAVAEAWPIVRRRLLEEGHLGYLVEIDLPLAWVLGEMELTGVAVDPEDLQALGRELGERREAVAEKIYALAGREFNIGSHKQLGEVLFDELGLPVIKRTKSGYSTDAEVLERLGTEHEIARFVVEHRKVSKLINTYTEVLQSWVHPKTGRIHANFQQTAGATGRLITTDPDLQRTPVRTAEGRRIRRSFVAREGSKLISADWSQIELRLLAHFTGDPGLIEGIHRDVHARTAAELFGVDPGAVTDQQRAIGKQVNFSTIYGQGARALGRLIGVSRRRAQRYIDGYFAAYAGVREWLDRTIAEAHERGFVETLFGRRRYIPELSSNSHGERQYGERVAANTPIQGSAADLCKLAMVAIARRFAERGLETRMVLQIHDELVFEAPYDEVDTVCRLVRREMEEVYPLAVPLVADVGVGASWAEAH